MYLDIYTYVVSFGLFFVESTGSPILDEDRGAKPPPYKLPEVGTWNTSSYDVCAEAHYWNRMARAPLASFIGIRSRSDSLCDDQNDHPGEVGGAGLPALPMMCVFS